MFDKLRLEVPNGGFGNGIIVSAGGDGRLQAGGRRTRCRDGSLHGTTAETRSEISIDLPRVTIIRLDDLRCRDLAVAALRDDEGAYLLRQDVP